MNHTTALLKELRSKLDIYKIPVLDLLKYPIQNVAEFKEKLTNEYGKDISIPDSLLDIYSWHNGTKTQNEDDRLIKLGYIADELFFNIVEDTIEIINEDTFYEFKKRRLFPFFTSFNGEYLAIELEGDYGIFYCSTWDIEIDNIVKKFDSIETLLLTLLNCYENDFFIINEDGFVQLKFDKYDDYMLLGGKLNPLSRYWILKREW